MGSVCLIIMCDLSVFFYNCASVVAVAFVPLVLFCLSLSLCLRGDFTWKRKLYADMQKRRHINYATWMNRIPTKVSYMGKNSDICFWYCCAFCFFLSFSLSLSLSSTPPHYLIIHLFFMRTLFFREQFLFLCLICLFGEASHRLPTM